MSNLATHASYLRPDGSRAHITYGVNSPAADATPLPSTTGDIRWNTDTTASPLGLLGWVCTAGASPGPGTWQAIDLRTALAAVCAHVLLDRHVDTSLFPQGVGMDLLGPGILKQAVSGGVATLSAAATAANVIPYVDSGGNLVANDTSRHQMHETAFAGSGVIGGSAHYSIPALYLTGHVGIQGLTPVAVTSGTTYHDLTIIDEANGIEFTGGAAHGIGAFIGGVVPTSGISAAPNPSGRVLFIRNSSASPIFLIEEDSGSATSSRLNLGLPAGNSRRIEIGDTVALYRNDTTSRWNPIMSTDLIGHWIIGGEYSSLGCPSTPATPTGLGLSTSETSNAYEWPINPMVARGAGNIIVFGNVRFFFAGATSNEVGITVNGSITDFVTVSGTGNFVVSTVLPPGATSAGLYTRNPSGTAWQIFMTTTWEFFR